MSQRLHVSTKAELDAFHALGYHWDDPKWEQQVWDIITRGLPLIDSLHCEYSPKCHNKIYKYTYNMAGEIHHVYCRKHWDEIMQHLRFFGELTPATGKERGA